MNQSRLKYKIGFIGDADKFFRSRIHFRLSFLFVCYEVGKEDWSIADVVIISRPFLGGGRGGSRWRDWLESTHKLLPFQTS